jgi:hypothetical protein
MNLVRKHFCSFALFAIVLAASVNAKAAGIRVPSNTNQNEISLSLWKSDASISHVQGERQWMKLAPSTEGSAGEAPRFYSGSGVSMAAEVFKGLDIGQSKWSYRYPLIRLP